MSQLVLKDIRDEWETILPGLELTKKKIQAPWRPVDVYAACVAGRAYLYSCDEGFIVVQQQINAFDGRPELFLWVAYARGQDSIERFQDQVDELASENGFGRIVMWSNRPGFQKSAGWNAVSTVYERVLNV